MRKTMLLLSVALAMVLTGGLLLTVAPTASAAGIHGGIVFVGPGPFFGPYYPYYGFYPYAPYFMAANYGQVQIDTHGKGEKNDDVYIDGGYAARLKDAKKFALRPGNHEIEVRSPDGAVVYQEKVAVTVGHTTKLHVS
jgi:hypothetical protein